jgi:hypothetical protein
MVDIRTILFYLSTFLDSIATWLYCCVISAFVVPLILERALFYIPTLIRLALNGEVQKKSVFITFGEVALWTSILVGEYIYLYYFQNNLFVFTTVSPAAIVAWVIGALTIIFRIINFSKTVKRNFYYNAYMRFIMPEAFDAYQKFIKDLDNLYADDMDALLEKKLPYMHRQAVLRKKRSLLQI